MYLCFPSSIRTFEYTVGSASMPRLLRLHRMEKPSHLSPASTAAGRKLGALRCKLSFNHSLRSLWLLASNYPYAFNPLGVGDTNVHGTFAARNLGPGYSVDGPLSMYWNRASGPRRIELPWQQNAARFIEDERWNECAIARQEYLEAREATRTLSLRHYLTISWPLACRLAANAFRKRTGNRGVSRRYILTVC